MEIWEPKPPGTLWATPGLLYLFSFYLSLGLQSGALPSGFTQKSCLHLFSTMWDTLLGLVATIYNTTLVLKTFPSVPNICRNTKKKKSFIRRGQNGKLNMEERTQHIATTMLISVCSWALKFE
jgi:hypothetical protein